MDAKITNAKTATPEQILAEAKTMWAKCRDRFRAGLAFNDVDGANDLMAQLRREHPEFCTSYPVVMRYMAEMQVFHPAALSKYLLKISERPWRSEEEYLESQADYVALLYRETNPRWDQKKVTSVRTAVLDVLKREHSEIKGLTEKIAAEVDDQERRLMNRSRADLREWLRKQREVSDAVAYASSSLRYSTGDDESSVDNSGNDKLTADDGENSERN